MLRHSFSLASEMRTSCAFLGYLLPKSIPITGPETLPEAKRAPIGAKRCKSESERSKEKDENVSDTSSPPDQCTFDEFGAACTLPSPSAIMHYLRQHRERRSGEAGSRALSPERRHGYHERTWLCDVREGEGMGRKDGGGGEEVKSPISAKCVCV